MNIQIQLVLQALAFVVTVFSLVFQQRALVKEREKAERRLTYKLRLFNILRERACSESDTIEKLKSILQVEQVDDVEVRKSLYEMISDGTMRVNDDGKYDARPETGAPTRAGQNE